MDVTLGAARLADGEVADAVVRVDWTEHQRRLACGLTAVTDLHALDRLLTFPLHELVSWPDLTPDDARVLKALPEGAVEFTETGVRRVFAPAADVDVVIARASRWQTGLRKAAAFAPFARRVLLLPRAPERSTAGCGRRTCSASASESAHSPSSTKCCHRHPGNADS